MKKRRNGEQGAGVCFMRFPLTPRSRLGLERRAKRTLLALDAAQYAGSPPRARASWIRASSVFAY